MVSACPTPGTTQVEWTQIGACQIWVTYTAGSTPYPDCDGTIESVRVLNSGTTPWTVRVPRAGRTGGREYTIAAGGDVTLNGQQLRSRGYDLLSEMRDLLLTLG